MLIISLRYRRISFRIIPDSFQDTNGENEYIKKLQRLIEFLEKQAQKKLDIRIFGSQSNLLQNDKQQSSWTNNRLVHFIIHLNKGKRDKYEWMEVTINSYLDTTKAFRIMFNWLVASSIKIEAQVQLLQRRCSQFNLNLIVAPTSSTHSAIYLHPVSILNFGYNNIIFIMNDQFKCFLILLLYVAGSSRDFQSTEL